MELTTKPAEASIETRATEHATISSPEVEPNDPLPYYSRAIAELALRGGCRSLLEFGAGKGWHLKAVRDHVKRRTQSDAGLTAIAIENEQALAAHPDASVDFVFTVSALALLDDPQIAITRLLGITRRFAAFLEPVGVGDKEGRLEIISGEGSGESHAPPIVYLHDYEERLRAANIQPCLVTPLPTQLNGAGPFCCLFVIDKSASDDSVDAETLKRDLLQLVMTQLLGDLSKQQTAEERLKRELAGTKRQLTKARDQLNRARINGERSVRRQLPHQAGEVLIDHMKRPYMLPILPWSLYNTYKQVRSGNASGGGRPSVDAAPIKSVIRRSPTTGLDELVLPRVSDSLLGAIRTSYNETYQRELGVTQGRGFFRDADWRRINYAIGLLPNGAQSALDVGVGAGVLLNYLTMADRLERVVGIDIDRHFNFLSLSNDVDWRQMDACSMSFPDNHFDIVFCMEVLEHLDDEQFEKALAELRRVTRHRLVASVPFDEPLPLPSFHKQHFDKTRIEHVFPTASVTLLHKQTPKKAEDGKASRICPWALMVEDQPLDQSDKT
ncbi:MAG: class I SAM-dependent methyltransferase [Pseudomonadota bacterium]